MPTPGTAQDRKQDELEKHSLPGTNQAGKGPGADDDEPKPDGADAVLPAGPKGTADPAPVSPASDPARVKKDM
jgi:hypothetical protein